MEFKRNHSLLVSDIPNGCRQLTIFLHGKQLTAQYFIFAKLCMYHLSLWKTVTNIWVCITSHSGKQWQISETVTSTPITVSKETRENRVSIRGGGTPGIQQEATGQAKRERSSFFSSTLCWDSEKSLKTKNEYIKYYSSFIAMFSETEYHPQICIRV